MQERNECAQMGTKRMRKGFGACTGANAEKHECRANKGAGRGNGCKHGLGKDSETKHECSKTPKERLTAKKAMLQDRIDAIDKELENL